MIENLNIELKLGKAHIGKLTKKLKHSLIKRNELAHQLKDAQDQVEEILEQFEERFPNEFEASV